MRQNNKMNKIKVSRISNAIWFTLGPHGQAIGLDLNPRG